MGGSIQDCGTKDALVPLEISDPARLLAKPRVSVVMLAYRHEHTLPAALEGVLAQDFFEGYELIIGEDCSADNTLALAVEYQQRHPDRIRVIHGLRNVGASCNSQRAIRAARGEFIALCEGDDYWHHPGKLTMQVAALRANPDAQLCHTDYDRRIGRWVLRSAHARRRPAHLAQGDQAYRTLLQGMTVKTATALYRRNFLQRFLASPFNRLDWPFGDYPKALLAATEGPVIYLPVSTATYRLQPGSAMYSGRGARLRMGQALAECREEFMQAYPVDDATALRVRRVGRLRQMRDGFLAGDKAQYLAGHGWLREHGPRPSPLLHRLRLFALRTRVPLRLLQGVRGVVFRLVSAISR